MAKLFDTFKGYSFTVGLFFILTLVGAGMDFMGHPNGKEFWQMFGMALAAFVRNQAPNSDDSAN